MGPGMSSVEWGGCEDMLADEFCGVVESGRSCPGEGVAEVVGEALWWLLSLARCCESKDTRWLGEPRRGTMALLDNRGRHRYIWSSGKVKWW